MKEEEEAPLQTAMHLQELIAHKKLGTACIAKKMTRTSSASSCIKCAQTITITPRVSCGMKTVGKIVSDDVMQYKEAALKVKLDGTPH